MLKVVGLDVPSKLLSKLNPDQIREALQPFQPKPKSVTCRQQHKVLRYL